ncbi:MAG TPA: hypothetical protein VFY10_08990 [Dehalococcoidia bacterium]|nr:hypothetical protein [Dehalococcoidia bacterium]
MAQYEDSYARKAAQPGKVEEVNGLALGFVLFAAVLMLMMGSFHFIEGLVAVINDKFYVVRPDYALEFDVSAWGWISMIGGVVLVVAGFGLISGSKVARIITILLAAISIIWNFFSIPYYPIWSIIMIVIGIGVIWALVTHGSDIDAPEML